MTDDRDAMDYMDYYRDAERRLRLMRREISIDLQQWPAFEQAFYASEPFTDRNGRRYTVIAFESAGLGAEFRCNA